MTVGAGREPPGVPPSREALPQAGSRRPDAGRLFAELLARGSLATLLARGGSMWPSLRDGDVLTVAPLGRAPVRGDIVLALRDGALLAHRVLAWDGACAVLRGDALQRPDGSFTQAELLGRVVRVRRGSRVLPRALYAGALPLALRPLTRTALRILRRVRVLA